MSSIEDQVLAKEWFYRFELPSGRHTQTYHQGQLDSIHQTRWQMAEQALQQRFGSDWVGLTAVDLACHQGYFAVQLAQRGFTDVVGIDVRDSHVADTRLIGQALELNQLTVKQSDVHSVADLQLGQFDVVLMLGLLYHLENPIGAMRAARALCKHTCLIETQIVPGMTGVVDYGSYRFVKPLQGSFGIVDETEETHGPEASVTGICLIPSLEALVWCLQKVGFSSVEVLQPPPDAYEQLKYKKRVMVAASV